ncbi:WXG100 family type VII secretion target [Actinophytocola xanthii]|uniref:WXG100 family type VII secretion target n=1 Tax=Actinophytocola xanthii TaxID=1912961 RepID=A0A1Q8BV26_9PSEU|nr:hypothetical protein [Actinophytocola xanthii]OLF05958.1 hypothetical protein BU204_36780 [Actinophytocola xanthii]
MNDGFEADPTRLRQQAGRFDDLAGRVAEIHRTLGESLDSAGPCWGGDAVGQSFGAAHVAPADSTLTRLGSLTEQLGGVGTRFAATADTYTGTDEAAEVRLLATEPDA